MSEDQKLLPVDEEQKLLDRPAEERLRDELDHREQTPAPKKREAPKPEEKKPKPTRKWLWLVLLIALILFAVIFVVGYLPRRNRGKATEKSSLREEEAIPSVDVAKVKRSPQTTRLLLPGNITPITEAPIYARASGYIVKRYADIGDHLRANQLMAVLEAPDLDQQVAQGRSQLSQARQQLGQAEAALQQSEAQLELAKVTWNRYAILVQHGAVAKQDADTQKANYDAAGATVSSSKANVRAAEDNVKSAQANLDRLIALQSYEQIRSPFAGMLPMSLALGEGGEQNAPLGRAVIGGLLVATFSTLFFVPIMYSFLRKEAPVNWEERIENEAHELLPEHKQAPHEEPQPA